MNCSGIGTDENTVTVEQSNWSKSINSNSIMVIKTNSVILLQSFVQYLSENTNCDVEQTNLLYCSDFKYLKLYEPSIFSTKTLRIDIDNNAIVSSDIFGGQGFIVQSGGTINPDYTMFTKATIENHPLGPAAYCLSPQEQQKPIPHINIHFSRDGQGFSNWHFGFIREDGKKCIVIFEKTKDIASQFCEKRCSGEKLDDLIKNAPYPVSVPEEALDRIINFYKNDYPEWFNGDYELVWYSTAVVGVGLIALAIGGALICGFSIGLVCPAA